MLSSGWLGSIGITSKKWVDSHNGIVMGDEIEKWTSTPGSITGSIIGSLTSHGGVRMNTSCLTYLQPLLCPRSRYLRCGLFCLWMVWYRLIPPLETPD